MRRSLDRDELLPIMNSVADYHKVFEIFIEMADVVYDDKVPTLAVELVDRSGTALDHPVMLINKEFWDKHDHREHLFMVLHECLHVILDHGERNGHDVPGATPELVNAAQDITINELIVDLFGYRREDFRDWKKYCWIDTCFKNPRTVKRNETFTYYLRLLVQEAKGGLPALIDVHLDAGRSGTDAQGRITEKLVEELTLDELQALVDALPEGSRAGTGTGSLEVILARKRDVKPPKLKFSAIVRQLKRSRVKLVSTDVETFSRDDRRFDDAVRRSGAVLPGKGAYERPRKDRLLTAVFMDISGSCIPYLKTFEQVFLAFDAERELFETRLFTFDTQVKDVRPGDRITGGGGTAYGILEQRCVELEAEYKRYPDCVVVITDGEGTLVEPKVPSSWVWLMTPYFSVTHVPRGSRWFTIKQVTF